MCFATVYHADANDLLAKAIAKTLIQLLQGTYPHPLLYQPELLRQKVIDFFSFERFNQSLYELIQTSKIIPL